MLAYLTLVCASFCLLLVHASDIITRTSTCPPIGFDSVADFDILAYASAPWYVQKQVRGKGAFLPTLADTFSPRTTTLAKVPVGYQPKEDLYCVRAIYKAIQPGNASVRR